MPKIVELFHRGYLQAIYLMIASLKQVSVLGAEKERASGSMTMAVAEITGMALTPQRFGEVVSGCQPVLLRNLVGHWPAVAAARRSPSDFRDSCRPF